MDPKILAKLIGLRLNLWFHGERFRRLDTVDAYLAATQYQARRYDWDARFIGMAGDRSIPAQHYVPMCDRQPSVERNLGKLIVSRLFAMAFGSEQWPEIMVKGDPDAADYVAGLCEAAEIPQKWLEAAEKGGAAGTVCVSYGFVDGLPRVLVHEAKHCKVLRWVDRDEFVVGAVLKAYRYPQWEIVDGRPKEVYYYSARYWDEEREIVWEPIPEERANDGTWATSVKSHEAIHSYGNCPFYWIQNLPDSEREDGQSCFGWMLRRFDQINYALSATNKGAIANVDATLVIKAKQGQNSGVVRTGADVAIFSEGGAEYAEIAGTAVEAAEKWIQRMEQNCLDEAGVVNADPHEIAAKAVSGEALKVVYMPMTAQCDKLRGQYGKPLRRLLRDMLISARRILGQTPGPIITTEDGRRLQAVPTVVLPPGYREEKCGEETISIAYERKPGTSSNVQLNWRTYFPPTPADVTAMVDSASKAKGTLIQQRTGTAYVAQVFGVKDIDAEVAAIEVEREEQVEQLMSAGPTVPVVGKSKAGETDDDEE